MELPGLDLICTKKPHTSACTDSCLNEPLPTPHSSDLIVGLTSMHNLFLLFQNYSVTSFFLKNLKKNHPPLPIYLVSLFHLYSPVLYFFHRKYMRLTRATQAYHMSIYGLLGAEPGQLPIHMCKSERLARQAQVIR